MKSRLIVFALAFGCLATLMSGRPHEEQWKQVDEAVRLRQPQTAIKLLDAFGRAAIAEKSFPAAIRAVALSIKLQTGSDQNAEAQQIARLQAEIAKAPAEMKPPMEAILAHWYWQYFQRNRWRFTQRTQTHTAPGDDIDTWDLARILAETERHFTAALADAAKLKATPVSAYDDLLVRGTAPDTYRPTMFDFLAHEALQFYLAGEQGAVVAEDDAFELDASTPVLDDANAAMAWRVPETGISSPARKAVLLYQELLRFHQHDVDRSAFYDVDLARLRDAYAAASGDNKDERYEAALERFITATERHEVSSRARAQLAEFLLQRGESAKAHEIAQRGARKFSTTVGAAECANLVRRIEARAVQIQTEQIWNAPWPTIDITYRNLDRVHFRVYRTSFGEVVAQSRYMFGDVADRRPLDEFRDLEPELMWSEDLPPTNDFKERTEHVTAPANLRPGLYFIVASTEESLSEGDSQISVARVWVSDLAVVLRYKFGSDGLNGLVVRAGSGEPVAGAALQLWHQNRDGKFERIQTGTTDADGRFALPTEESAVVLYVEHDGEAVSTDQVYAANYRPDRSQDRETSTVFFTDRAIYRPGQTIQYKGLCLQIDHGPANYHPLGARPVSLSFRDRNGQELGRAEHRTNAYGSFWGEFTPPPGRVTGAMVIMVASGPSGMTSVNVEEYKRPKFEVTLEAPVEAPKLDATIGVAGKALAYNGAPITGAKVRWRVERSVILPRWCWWWQPPQTKAIAHGTAQTQADGRFRVDFSATPDRSVPQDTEPRFTFTVYADITDTTGETRSEQRAVNVGYSALQASISADEWQTGDRPVTLKVKTQSLDGDPQPATGSVTIYTVKQPTKVQRAPLNRAYPMFRFLPGRPPEPDPTNLTTWDRGDSVLKQPFAIEMNGSVDLPLTLQPGVYRAVVETKDRFGRAVTAQHTFEVLDVASRRYRTRVPNRFVSAKATLEPGETFTAVWGTGYDRGRAFVEIECAGKTLHSYWTSRDSTQERIEVPVDERMRGGFTVRTTYVRENRGYFTNHVVAVPWTNKELTVSWERFRSKLLPGEKETWTAIVKGPDAKRAAAEMVAALYDASLDQFAPHAWTALNVFRREQSSLQSSLQNHTRRFGVRQSWRSKVPRRIEWRYRSFPEEVVESGQTVTLSAFQVRSADVTSTNGAIAQAVELPKVSTDAVVVTESRGVQHFGAAVAARATIEPAPPAPPKPNLTTVTARKNLAETAFFFPHLVADEDGVVKITFTMPEALTRWKFLGLAHDRDLRSGLLTDTVVTAKDLMVEPNPPRFLREGDVVEFAVKVTNRSDKLQSGVVRLTFADAASLSSVDASLGNNSPEQSFQLGAGESRSVAWRISVPDGLGFLTYKAVAAAGNLSDGEEGNLPVLSRRVLVTESLPLPIRGRTTKDFEFAKLLSSGSSQSLRHVSLTAEMTSQPAWYAVMALPYLMEYPYECSEQVFNRVYANALARHVALSDPKIRRIFDLWRGTSTLSSPLEKNQELKSVMLEETPWVRSARAESDARHDVGLLFDQNRLDTELASGLKKLADQQLGNGLWPWFSGGQPSEYISLYIVAGFGRLRQMGVTIDPSVAIKALAALDAAMAEQHARIKQHGDVDKYMPSTSDALYLYARSFFLKDQPIAGNHREMIDFYLWRARDGWTSLGSRQSQAHLALALHRFGDKVAPAAIMRSLKERSTTSEELGMYWRDGRPSWWWYEAPIETQAVMIEAFDEVAHDPQAVADCKVWLLKQKQTQNWPTTKSTADAVYALLVRGGESLLASDARVELSLGGEVIKPEKVEAGTGFYERKFSAAEFRPELGHIRVTKTDDGVSWGAVHWQYLEDVAKVTPHEGTPLRVTKTLWIKETTNQGQVLKPVTGTVTVGDELVVRIELRTDRDMDFVHLKDQRGSGTEPVNVLSRYKYQDGLAYYESTRDTASHFFIDHLRAGTYVFEYSTRVQLKGTYQTGIAEVQCMYAPEFNSHSESITLEVK